MKRILENMDSAAAGKKPAVGSGNVNDMKSILESFNNVNECGMTEMPMGMPDADAVTMNVTLNARGTDAIADLIKLMGGTSSSPQSTEMPIALPGPTIQQEPESDMEKMKKFINISSTDSEVEPESEPEVEEEWTNSPDEEYSDHHTMTKDLSGGLNRRKKMFKPAAKGDNPMALESIKETLYKALAAKKAK